MNWGHFWWGNSGTAVQGVVTGPLLKTIHTRSRPPQQWMVWPQVPAVLRSGNPALISLLRACLLCCLQLSCLSSAKTTKWDQQTTTCISTYYSVSAFLEMVRDMSPPCKCCSPFLPLLPSCGKNGPLLWAVVVRLPGIESQLHGVPSVWS